MSEARTIRLNDAVDSYLQVREVSFCATTTEQDSFVCRRFAVAMGNPLVRELRAEQVEAWFHSLLRPHRTRDGRERPPIQASTYNYYYARVKALTQFLAQRGYLSDDVLRYVRPRKPEVKSRVRAEREVLWSIIDSADNARDRAILATALNTGLRASEIADLRVGDVDLASQSLGVRITKSKLEDVMPLTSDLQEELVRWMDTYRRDTAGEWGRPLRATDYLFPARTGPLYRYRHGPDGSQERYLGSPRLVPHKRIAKLHVIAQRALKAVGLPTRHQGVHTLRRSAARALFDSLVAESGFDGALRVTSSFLHHSNSSTTELYLGLARERQVRDAHLRGRSLLGPREPASDAAVIQLRGVQPQPRV